METVAVKEGLSHGAAVSVTPVKARMMIKEGVKKAMLKTSIIPPFKVEKPVKLVVEFTEENKSSAETLSKRPGVKKIDDRTIKIEGNDLLEALEKWWM